MPRAKKTKQTVEHPSKFTFKGFFNPQLNDDIKTAVKALPDADGAVMARLLELSEAGFKIGVSSDDAATHYTFTLTDKRQDSDSQGYCLSVKHSNLSTAVTLAYVLQDQIYDWSGWLPYIKGTTEIDW